MDSATKETPEVEYEPNNTVSNGSKWTGKLNSTRDYVWNSSKREFIGRTWSSWAKIGLFYFTFYSCLVVFFAIMLLVFYSTLDNTKPTQTGMASLIKQNPGMGYRPMVDIEDTTIRFKQGKPDSYKHLVDNIDEFLNGYYFKQERTNNVINCTERKPDISASEVCDIRDTLNDSLPCSRAVDYGFAEGMPCILLKLNNVYGWEPKNFTWEHFNNTEDKHAQAARAALGNETEPNPDHILVTCEGETANDRDITTKMSFYPSDGFPFWFYPYMNYPNYRQPLVFVRFEGLQPGQLVQIWCKAWARNIKHHDNDRAGSLKLEIQMD